LSRELKVKRVVLFALHLNDGFGPRIVAALCRLQQELDSYGFEWENDVSVVRAIKDSSVKQCGNIGVDGLNITPNTPRSFAD
jgi:hypothetical protein